MHLAVDSVRDGWSRNSRRVRRCGVISYALSRQPYCSSIAAAISACGPSESPLSQPGQTPPCKATDDNRTATALGDVAWAAAGVLGPQGTSFGAVALLDPSRCQCLSVVRS